MKIKTLIISALMVLSVLTASQADEMEEELHKYSMWMTYYYQKPDPSQAVPAIQTFSKAGAFDDETAHGPMIAFMSILFRDNRPETAEWVLRLEKLPEFHKTIIWEALWLADTPEASECIKEILPKIKDKKRAENYRALFTQSPPDLMTMPLALPEELDMMWAAFSASGDAAYIGRIIDTLEYINSKDPGKTVTGHAAKWSLTANCMHHPKVLEICESEIPLRTGALRTELEEIVRNAKRVKE
ncbi:MAG: hypothetical protein JXJ19_02030 [Elusimicrobia bacterium]|nr:hypothetical protein [Elusimicrobiota bacterium]